MPWVCRNSLETQPNTCTFLKKVGSGGDETGNTEGCLGGGTGVLSWGRVGGGGRWGNHGAVASGRVDWGNWGSGGWGHWGVLHWGGGVDWGSLNWCGSNRGGLRVDWLGDGDGGQGQGGGLSDGVNLAAVGNVGWLRAVGGVDWHNGGLVHRGGDDGRGVVHWGVVHWGRGGVDWGLLGGGVDGCLLSSCWCRVDRGNWGGRGLVDGSLNGGGSLVSWGSWGLVRWRSVAGGGSGHKGSGGDGETHFDCWLVVWGLVRIK